MSSHERLSTDEAGYGTIELVVPEEMDENWCAMFTQAYGLAGLRIMLYSNSYVRDVTLGRRRANYKQQIVYNSTHRDVIFDGRFHGIRMFPIGWIEEDRIYYSTNFPHAILTEAVDLDNGECFTAYQEERILVPLTDYEPGEKIMLYH